MSWWVAVVFSAVRRERKNDEVGVDSDIAVISLSSQIDIWTIDRDKNDRMCWYTNTTRIFHSHIVRGGMDTARLPLHGCTSSGWRGGLVTIALAYWPLA
jgi:hypothetical protein